MRTLLLAAIFLAATAANAEVYKWVDEKGVVHYTDQPPSDNAKPAKLPPLQTYKEGALPKLEQVAPPANPGAAKLMPWEVTLLSPVADQTYRSESQGQVPVTVQVTPALAEGQQLIYYLDGAVQGADPSPSYTLSGLERGSHTVAVGLIDASGVELARSATVTIHMKQSSVLARPPAATPNNGTPPARPPAKPAGPATAPRAPQAPRPPGG